MSDYPEHDKLHAISEQSQVCGEFLEWLQGGFEGSPNLHVVRWKDESDAPKWVHERTGEPVPFANRRAVENPDYYPSGYYSPGLNTQELLAMFFGIDQAKIDKEKEQILAAMRAANA